MTIESEHKYGLDCNYWPNTFNSIEELVQAVMHGGIDPNHEITKDGVGIGETVADFITL